MSGVFGFPLGVAMGIAATVLAVGGGATGNPIVSVVAMVVVVDIMAMVTTVGAVLATMVVCWFLHAGFVLGRHGELAFTPQSGHDALVFLGVALSALALASALRAARVRYANSPYIPAQRQSEPVLGKPSALGT